MQMLQYDQFVLQIGQSANTNTPTPCATADILAPPLGAAHGAAMASTASTASALLHQSFGDDSGDP